MGLFRVGDKDRDGRQKRIEHAGEHLRVSRTGGVSLRAQTRAAGVNATVNTSRGLRLSTRLARNTQVAMQNGRFVLRGRYGTDAARFNLSKTGVTVSTRTGIGAINLVRPGRSSAKVAGIQVRGRNALALQGVYLAFTALNGLFQAAAGLVQSLLSGIWRIGTAVQRRRLLREQERQRIGLERDTVEPVAAALEQRQAFGFQHAASRDLLAALTLCLVAYGRGLPAEDLTPAALGYPEDPAAMALAADLRGAATGLASWLATDPSSEPEDLAAITLRLAESLAERLDTAQRTELLLSLDDACLVLGAKTVLQEELLDLLAEVLDIRLQLEGER